MFCPKCGNPNQTENSYCRNCGVFLPEFNKLIKEETTPEQQIIISATFISLSAIVSLVLTIVLHILYTGKEGTPIIIYAVIGFLTANFFWQAQAFWRVRKLKKHLPKRRAGQEQETKTIENQYSTEKLLPQADLKDLIVPSVVEDTTKILKQKIKSS